MYTSPRTYFRKPLFKNNGNQFWIYGDFKTRSLCTLPNIYI